MQYPVLSRSTCYYELWEEIEKKNQVRKQGNRRERIGSHAPLYMTRTTQAQTIPRESNKNSRPPKTKPFRVTCSDLAVAGTPRDGAQRPHRDRHAAQRRAAPTQPHGRPSISLVPAAMPPRTSGAPDHVDSSAPGLLRRTRLLDYLIGGRDARSCDFRYGGAGIALLQFWAYFLTLLSVTFRLVTSSQLGHFWRRVRRRLERVAC